MHACTIITWVSLILGVLMSFLVTLSLPFISSLGGVAVYIVEIDYEVPLNGELDENSALVFYNLTRLRVSLAAFLLNHDQT